MSVSNSYIQNQLKFNVMELKFLRRHEKVGSAFTRRGLFTTSYSLLNSPVGRRIFRFDPPRFPPAYPYAAYNLVCAFDCIISLDWRMLPCEGMTVIEKFDVRTLKSQREFWKLFEERFQNLSIDQRKAITDV